MTTPTKRTPKLDRPEHSNPDEVTRPMREAGAAVIEELRGVVSAEFLAEQVYSAMARVSASKLQAGSSAAGVYLQVLDFLMKERAKIEDDGLRGGLR